MWRNSSQLNQEVISPQHKTRPYVGVCNVTCYFATRPAIKARQLNQVCHFFCKKNRLSLFTERYGLIRLAVRPLRLIGRFCGHGARSQNSLEHLLILYKWLLHHHHLLIPIRHLNEASPTKTTKCFVKLK